MKKVHAILLAGLILSAPAFAGDLSHQSRICKSAASTAKAVTKYAPRIMSHFANKQAYMEKYREVNVDDNFNRKVPLQLNAFLILANRNGVAIGWDAGANDLSSKVVYSLVYDDCMSRPMVWILGMPTLDDLFEKAE